MSAVTEWLNEDGRTLRRYVVDGSIASEIYRMSPGPGLDDGRVWRMAVWRIEPFPWAWWRYATREEAMAGADEELSALIGEVLP